MENPIRLWSLQLKAHKLRYIPEPFQAKVKPILRSLVYQYINCRFPFANFYAVWSDFFTMISCYLHIFPSDLTFTEAIVSLRLIFHPFCYQVCSRRNMNAYTYVSYGVSERREEQVGQIHLVKKSISLMWSKTGWACDWMLICTTWIIRMCLSYGT